MQPEKHISTKKIKEFEEKREMYEMKRGGALC
jgi:hypothetical protein